MDQAAKQWPESLSNSEIAGIVEYMARAAGVTLDHNVLMDVAKRLKEMD